MEIKVSLLLHNSSMIFLVATDQLFTHTLYLSDAYTYYKRQTTASYA